jgi:ATP-dependent helicase/nuclease subunit A
VSVINLKIISAGAGSGKTFRLTAEMVELITNGVRTSGIIATTFTSKAAAELQERVRVKLLEEGLFEAANDLPNAMIGTVHSIGVKLLQRFAFEAGVSPEVSIMAAEDSQVMFNNALSTILTEDRIIYLEHLSTRLGLNKKGSYDWRKNIREITDIARGNDFNINVLEKSKKMSFESFQTLLPPRVATTSAMLLDELVQQLDDTIYALQESSDETKKTQDALKDFKQAKNEILQHKDLAWHQWVKLGKADVSVKSRAILEPLRELIAKHEALADFQDDIKGFIDAIFDMAMAAMEEFQQYKKMRGLIDYTDMEVLVKRLLDLPEVQAVLREELDLLMVDEFQDTNPIQLDIFFKLSQYAKNSIWVGDPKQSIYGFRGADPRLMQAIVDAQGGVKKEDIQLHSYRSRPDLVNATNAIFAKAFKNLPEAQVALIPKRQEHAEFSLALKHWHFRYDGEGRAPDKKWFNHCIADALRISLAEGIYVEQKDKSPRLAQPSDVSILCRTNDECREVAEALHHVGLKAAIARTGLLATAEAQLLLACLKYTLYASDSLSIAEILTLATDLSTAEIIEDRLRYVVSLGDNYDEYQWASGNYYIEKINELRDKAREFSASELLNLLLEELDLRRLIMSWGNTSQRLDNVDIVRKMALEYEDACNRLQSAASLGGFLLWLDNIAAAQTDAQASGEQADAVNILTYHRSKGLEWPITICHALEGDLRDNIWGVSIIAEEEKVDLNDLLGKRWLRFWVNPYSDQSRGTPLLERIEQSEAQSTVTIAALEEEARLLYVGITRARDYLIFPSRKTPTKWLNRTWHKQEHTPTLDPESQATEWEWQQQFVPIESTIFSYDKDIARLDMEDTKYQYFAERYGRSEHKPYHIDLERESFGLLHRNKVGKVFNYDSPLLLPDTDNPALFAKALCFFYQSYSSQLPQANQLALINQLFTRLGFENRDGSEQLKRAKKFEEWLAKKFDIQAITKQYPIVIETQQRLFKTQIDILLETRQGLIVVQNDAFNGDRLKEKAEAYKDWAYFTRKSLAQNAAQATSVTFLIHFPFSGALVEVD